MLGMNECFVGLGGNFSRSFFVVKDAFELIEGVDGVRDFRASKIYRTSPVSNIAQNDYFNAVCRFKCELPFMRLWEKLGKIEKKLGKTLKEKNAPRLIDLDLLFYGEMVYHSQTLTVPHPRWHERLFVLAPLAEVADILPFGIRMAELLEKFKNPHGEEVVVCSE